MIAADPGLATAVAEGRRAEFGAHGWGPAEVPNPQDEQTFLRSKLDWAERDTPRHQEILAWYRELIALRRAWPELTDPRLDRMRADYDEAQRWLVLHRGRLRIAASLGEQPLLLPLGARGTAVLAASQCPRRSRLAAGRSLSMPPACLAPGSGAWTPVPEDSRRLGSGLCSSAWNRCAPPTAPST